MGMPLERYESGDAELARVRRTLRAIGIPARAFLSAALAGYTEADLVEAHHPVSYAGIKRWAETIGSLREYLMRQGWTPREEDGITLAVSPDEQVVVTAWRGDHNTGMLGSGATPQPARPRREGSRRVVTRHSQYSLPFEGVEEVVDSSNAAPMWVMLHRKDGDFIRVEALLAQNIEAGSGLIEWGDRLILPPVEMGLPDPCYRANAIDDGNDEEPPTVATEPVDVPVTPRTK